MACRHGAKNAVVGGSVNAHASFDHDRGVEVGGKIARLHEDDRPSVVARLLQERLRLLEIRLLKARRAGGRRKGLNARPLVPLTRAQLTP
jgi:hypothetical protein